jgi:hypothetical protein
MTAALRRHTTFTPAIPAPLFTYILSPGRATLALYCLAFTNNIIPHCSLLILLQTRRLATTGRYGGPQ